MHAILAMGGSTMPEINAYLHFNGNCAEAMRFYERALDGKIDMMLKASDTPAASNVPAGKRDRIMHARLSIDGAVLMASDWLDTRPFEPMRGFSLSLEYRTVGEAKRVYDALAQGAEIRQPLQKTFWSEAFAMLVDRFGTPWMISGPETAGA